jgi:hypothetical protein
MEIWESITREFLSTAVVVSGITYVAKSVFNRLIDRDSKTFASNLKLKADAEIERLKSEINNSLESYKIQLKKSEVFFQRELDAASLFSSIFHSIYPRFITDGADSDEMYARIAQDFARIEKSLRDFLAKHGAVLMDADRDAVVSQIHNLAVGKNNVQSDGPEIDDHSIKLAGEIYKELRVLESKLIERVRAQAAL